jgi:hypothetical protein
MRKCDRGHALSAPGRLDLYVVRRHGPVSVPAIVVVACVGVAFTATASALSVSRFTVTPSTTQAGSHPTLDLTVSFEPPSADIKSIVLHFPAGLTANAQAAPFCPRGQLLSDLCSLGTKVGAVTLVGEALGFQAEAKRNIYNLKPDPGQRLRLGVPIAGSFSRGGFALVLPVTARADGGLDVAVAGPPREVAGYPVRLKEVSLRLQGVIRRKVRRTVRKRALLTNPRDCRPATTVLDVASYDSPAVSTRTSAFTPTGC